MTDLYAFDAAYAPNLNAVKAAGGIAVNGYLDGAYQNSTTQPAAALAAGLGYIPTYEEGPAELVNATRATGQTVGQRILADFKRLGLPLDGTVAVYPSVDVNVGNSAACDQGWLGMRDVLTGKVSLRVYAEGAIIDHLTTAGLVDGKCWLAAPTSWPGYNATDANVCMVQQVGSYVAGTDRNHIITDPHAIGAYWPANSPYGGSDMSAAEVAEIKAYIDAAATSTYTRIMADLRNGGDLADVRQAIGELEKFIKPTNDAAANTVIRVATLQDQVDALKTQLSGVGVAVTAIPTVHPTIDPALVQQAAHDGTKAALTGATIAATFTPGA